MVKGEAVLKSGRKRAYVGDTINISVQFRGWLLDKPYKITNIQLSDRIVGDGIVELDGHINQPICGIIDFDIVKKNK